MVVVLIRGGNEQGPGANPYIRRRYTPICLNLLISLNRNLTLIKKKHEMNNQNQPLTHSNAIFVWFYKITVIPLEILSVDRHVVCMRLKLNTSMLIGSVRGGEAVTRFSGSFEISSCAERRLKFKILNGKTEEYNTAYS